MRSQRGGRDSGVEAEAHGGVRGEALASVRRGGEFSSERGRDKTAPQSRAHEGARRGAQAGAELEGVARAQIHRFGGREDSAAPAQPNPFAPQRRHDLHRHAHAGMVQLLRRGHGLVEAQLEGGVRLQRGRAEEQLRAVRNIRSRHPRGVVQQREEQRHTEHGEERGGPRARSWHGGGRVGGRLLGRAAHASRDVQQMPAWSQVRRGLVS